MATVLNIRAHALHWSVGVAGLALGTLACGGSRPSESDGERALRASIDGGSEERLNLRSFQKVDGVSAEVSGIKLYTLMFSAEGEFVNNASFSAGGPLTSGDRMITTRPYVPPSRNFSWDDALAGSQGFRPAMRGDRLRVTGRIQFEKRESGWHATDVALAYSLDSSSRAGGRQAGTAPGVGDQRANAASSAQTSSRVSSPAGDAPIEVLSAMRSDLRNLVMAQEARFAEFARYADELSGTHFRSSSIVSTPTIVVTNGGYTATVTSSRAPGVLCAVASGSATNPVNASAKSGEPECK